MARRTQKTPRSRQAQAKVLATRACAAWDRGKLNSAFRLFLRSAKLGDSAAQLDLGYFYDRGLGVRRNCTAALRWYGRAYRQGDASAACNIGTVWRDANEPERAIRWFQRAARMGDGDANLQIAKVYLRKGRNRKKALHYLGEVLRAKNVTQYSVEQATRLLRRLRANGGPTLGRRR
jgi:TPR repeat protein